MHGSFENDREGLIRIIGDLYASGRISEDEMNSMMGKATHASTPAELRELADLLPVHESDFALMTSFSRAPDQVITATGGSVHKRGDWLRSKRIRVTCTASSCKFDFSHYADRNGLTVEIELDLKSSSVAFSVPPGYVVEDAVSENNGSVIRVKEKGNPEARRNRIILSGKVKSSSIMAVIG